MSRLGYSKRDMRHLYLAEFIDKYRTYKKLFNFEKIGAYNLDYKPQVSDLRDM